METSSLSWEKVIQGLVEKEALRQASTISLIASENYASDAVMALQGSILTNKYAEGYPGRRYYAGCECVDEIEQLAIDLLKKLFNAEYANVQPHSGSQANAAVYLALMNPGDTILGMQLASGGHLTHGFPYASSGKYYQGVHYGVNEEGWIDMAEVRRLALAHKPKVIVAGYSAYAQLLDWKAFREIADEVGAYLLADIAHIAGLIAAKQIPSPFPYAHVVTSTTHKTLAGPRGGIILSSGQSEAFYRKLNGSLFPGTQGGPLVHVIAAKAMAFAEALQPAFVQEQKQLLLNTQAFVETFKEMGVKMVTHGSANHLLLIDVTPWDLTGLAATVRLHDHGLVVNQNTIPGETRSPFEASGIRIGTPALTRRGMKEPQAAAIAEIMVSLLDPARHHPDLSQQVHQSIHDLCERFPIPSKLAI